MTEISAKSTFLEEMTENPEKSRRGNVRSPGEIGNFRLVNLPGGAGPIPERSDVTGGLWYEPVLTAYTAIRILDTSKTLNPKP